MNNTVDLLLMVIHLNTDAVAHNFITRDGYTDILQTPTVVVIQGPFIMMKLLLYQVF